eukprot:4967444-Pyramimonas_sp.AAC.1
MVVTIDSVVKLRDEGLVAREASTRTWDRWWQSSRTAFRSFHGLIRGKIVSSCPGELFPCASAGGNDEGTLVHQCAHHQVKRDRARYGVQTALAHQQYRLSLGGRPSPWD